MLFISYIMICGIFQSTHPARGATKVSLFDLWIKPISIHAPREGCDEHALTLGFDGDVFQSTHPARGATTGDPSTVITKGISIHAPREGCDIPLFFSS